MVSKFYIIFTKLRVLGYGIWKSSRNSSSRSICNVGSFTGVVK